MRAYRRFLCSLPGARPAETRRRAHGERRPLTGLTQCTVTALLSVLALGPLALAAPPATNTPHRMEITLQRQEGSQWVVIDPGLVLSKGDHVRFLFRANFDGYLYVMDQGTSGHYELLFPREETGRKNRVKAGRQYRIPATQAWFRVDGPPGQDIVYWLVTPMTLGSGGPGKKYIPLPPPPKQKAVPANLMPMCDDSIFRARGICVDSSAGPRGIAKDAEVPENLAGVPRVTSRELIIMRKKDSSLISSPVSLEGPLLYQFRLAHK